MRHPNFCAGRAFRLTLLLIILSEHGRGMVQWESPAAGDRFGPNETIDGKWQTDSPVVSPSFKLCASSSPPQVSSRDNDDQISCNGDVSSCGETVWPTIQHGNGSYSASLAVPNVTSDEVFYLLMTDNFGTKHCSPLFLLSPTSSSATAQIATSTPTPVPVPNSNTAQSPFGSPLTGNPAPVATSALSPASLPASSPNILATRSPPPIAAFVVPLCCVGAILLVAAGLCVRHNRQLDQERAHDAEKLAVSRNSSFGSFRSHQSDVLSKSQTDVYHYGSAMPVPLFMPVEMSRERTRQMPYFSPPMYYHGGGRKTSYSRSTSSRSSKRSDSSHSSHSQSSTRLPSRKNSNRIYLPSITPSPLLVDFEERDAHHGTSVTDDVLSEYMQPSPIPPDCLLPAPQKLHVRKEAVDLEEERRRYARMNSIDLYDAVQNTLRRPHNT
ncbi:uncharacterized protein EV420DRAFT_1133382 [Desarmillaria tabescens]|uniref:Uncharacterized protein n=1 Tax=Armillaria tabescens TaxID=1929756 RepID=A0AA39JH38_ARMTA|nr:uncharacterized protein EV420DRAFT_1133382 [Desarmillaria tabescens]KAK0440398.1 hypothetical protein EV420DRAFT_1133382 [Desarmillaria tabescens]